jgi:hypothetical protein
MARGRRSPSHSWIAFLRNHDAGIAAVDLLVVPTIGFHLPPDAAPAWMRAA